MAESETEEELRRRQEINNFAAMALGLDEPETVEFDSKQKGDTDKVDTTDSRAMFQGLVDADAGDSGTFAFQSSVPPKASEQSNLDAAVAALSGTSEQPQAFTHDIILVSQPKATPRKDAEDFPMFAEEVCLPRPLFFGAVLPPRVLKEARSMVKEGLKDIQGPPRLSQLPPALRNVVGVIRTYGHGIDILNSIGDEKEDLWRGSPYMPTFQPVWGEDLRQDRVKEFRKHRRPMHVTRASTAPARLGSTSSVLVDSSILTEPGEPSGPPEETRVKAKTKMSDNEQFSLWLRAEEDATSLAAQSVDSLSSSGRSFDAADSTNDASSASTYPGATSKSLSEQELFSRWARGGYDSGTLRDDHRKMDGSGLHYRSSSLQRMPRVRTQDSDDDSVIDDELKKQVGVSDHLSRAIASLADDDGRPSTDMVIDGGKMLLSQVPSDTSSKRPLTNFELTGGCVPIFADDDSPLPVLGDLGEHQYREDQLRYAESKYAQEIIEKCVAPNVFGSVACPNPAVHPNDFHSWNFRSGLPQPVAFMSGSLRSDTSSLPSVRRRAGSTGQSVASGTGSKIPSIQRKQSDLKASSKKKRFTSRIRYGWWSVPEEEVADAESTKMEETKDQVEGYPTQAAQQLPPLRHSSSAQLVATSMEPTPAQLRRDNLPLSRMHAATAMAQTLPYLSDRPPSYRYLQVDTQFVQFPPVGVEIEPFFCSVAIYHIETISTGTSGDNNAAPVPNLPRCGRVTELLYFDYVGDAEVSSRCAGALWPYRRQGVEPTEDDGGDYQGTRCGVFPLPSNLNISNLYVVLIVRKVASDESDLDPYLKPGKTSSDLAKLRSHAERAAASNGDLLTPFAFGVAPLLQVFGTDIPMSPASRAVQIPLFRYAGEHKIIDHIMVMLFPRANHQASGIGGPAVPTNGGIALLVMRNFGFLGLHPVVDKKSSLCRENLVDFTGELQLSRVDPVEVEPEGSPESFRVLVPGRNPQFSVRPAVSGGRSLVPNGSPGASHAYAQELAPVPLHLSPGSRITQPQARSPFEEYDIEPYFHTSFCNELLFQPRILHNCIRTKVAVKVELREIEWNEGYKSYIAHESLTGPSLHNPRRGPFLVQSAFTSCAVRSNEHQFIDEFKVKLPLDLKPARNDGVNRYLALFFTVYRIKSVSKSKWKRAVKVFTSSSSEATMDTSDSPFQSKLQQVACGFLPLTAGTCLLDDGLHDVRVIYKAMPPTEELAKAIPESSLILVEIVGADSAGGSARDDSLAEDTYSTESTFSESMYADQYGSHVSDNLSVVDEPKIPRSKAVAEPLSLSVRVVVHSVVHTQNEFLTDLMNHEPDLPYISSLPSNIFLSVLRMGREFVLNNVAVRSLKSTSDVDSILLQKVAPVMNHELCSVPRSAVHMLRIMPILWKSFICGNGEPDLAWADPSAPLPLRLQSFAAVLHLLGAVTVYLAKNGATQLDGVSKWSLGTTGKIFALCFNEKSLFGRQSVEAFDEQRWLQENSADRGSIAGSQSAKKSPKKRRHIRRNYDLSNDLPPRLDLKAADSLSEPPSITKGHSRRGAASPIEVDGNRIPVDAVIASEEDPNVPRPKRRDLFIDSKTDFQNALRASASDDDFDKPEGSGAAAAKALVQALGGSAGNARRWMTAPTRGLSTIREADDADDSDHNDASSYDESMQASDVIFETRPADEMVRSNKKSSVKQMRVPRKHVTLNADSAKMSSPTKVVDDFREVSTPLIPFSAPLVPQSDEEIESAGTAFLDRIGQSLGLSTSSPRMAGEERGVGSSHHRKTRSRSSIDWTLLGLGDEGLQTDEEVGFQPEASSNIDDDETMASLGPENASTVRLPGFVDRLVAMGKISASSARWFPYAYEVIIMQWAAVLAEQKRLGENPVPAEAEQPDITPMTQVAARTVGVAVASAPLLFEVIKQSLGFRLVNLFRDVLSKSEKWHCPPLVTLDDDLQGRLEQIVSMVTDACLDGRNFDSWDLRQMSIDVNDSIIGFLRDMFSFVSPISAHKLVLVYFSRFVTKERKHWQDRESELGQRISWEIAKLRLSAITAFVRFPDFLRVSSPHMMSWGNQFSVLASRSNDAFFDALVEKYALFQSKIQGLVNEPSDSALGIGTDRAMRPHWLAEIVVDICLHGAEHVEQYIQHRASSLLYELFWHSSQESILRGNSPQVAGMFLTLIEKLAKNVKFLSSFAPKNPLRSDIIPCLLFVLESTPSNLLRALWRKCCLRLPGKGSDPRYGFVDKNHPEMSPDFADDRIWGFTRGSVESADGADALDMFSLLNLALKTIEYEGSDENVEADSGGDSRERVEVWKNEYLLTQTPINEGRVNRNQTASDNDEDGTLSSSVARKWQAHDGSLAIINAGYQIVWEMYLILSKNQHGRSLLNPEVHRKKARSKQTAGEWTSDSDTSSSMLMSYADVVVFVRGATSVFLHALALRASDIVVVRTIKVSAEVIKIFGIKIFLNAVGETLQHWMRVVLHHCGARRAQVRIESTDLLELILRSTWECYGSFFRIRLPLLAVQTEVMERIVATAGARHYREQRKLGNSFESFSIISAEASLVPLWRTLDRMEKQPASRNVAFRGALIRMAEKLKKLYRAYVAARVLSFIQGSVANPQLGDESESNSHETEAIVRANRISILCVLNKSEGYSKQFLGIQGTTGLRHGVAHFEAIEDALIGAADVFSPTELPEHRVAWLRMLADCHHDRKKHAEEATSHFQIHATLHQAARLHGSFWSNTPFLPWTDNIPDPVYIDGDSPNNDPDLPDFSLEDGAEQYGRRLESTSSFRRIFYRVANSVGMANDDWMSGVNRNLFFGVTLPFEYNSVTPWTTLRRMEEDMVDEAEAAGSLFLKADIIESSRYCWSLATRYYADKFNYFKLGIAYGNLANTVISQVPSVDPGLPQEVSAILGRFYRVWFHGAAPDDLSGVEFVYRTEASIRLDKFGQSLREVIKSIIPEKTPIHLVLDGRIEELQEDANTEFGFSRIGSTPLDPVKIKVTPLRPIFDEEGHTRGLPEWFYRYADEAFSGISHRSRGDLRGRAGLKRSDSIAADSGYGIDPHHREHARSFSASVFSSAGSSNLGAIPGLSVNQSTGAEGTRSTRFSSPVEGELSGVNKFCFVQPRDRSRGTKEWWRSIKGDFAEKSLKVTQLQVAQPFPACVARQVVAHRLVYSQSPLEAGVDVVCQWCSVLFRTAVATKGMAVLGTKEYDPRTGIGTEAAKVVADCIHSSHVKEIGIALLKKNTDLLEGDTNGEFALDFDRLSEDEVKKLQLKLARLIIVFIELLHLLIARNRDILLDVIQERKKEQGSAGKAGRVPSVGSHEGSERKFTTSSVHSRRALSAVPDMSPAPRNHKRALTDGARSDGSAQDRTRVRPNHPTHHRIHSDDQSQGTNHSPNAPKTESAIAVQSELQRAFISLCKSLFPPVKSILQDETPKWLRNCCSDSYFPMRTYQSTEIPIAEELCFHVGEGYGHPDVQETGNDSPRGSIGGGSTQSFISRGSERPGFGVF